MSSKSSRGQLVFRSSLLEVLATRGPFGRLLKNYCDFGDMTPHTLVGGDQTTLTARASVRADRRDDASGRGKGGLGTSRGHQVPPPRGFGPVARGPQGPSGRPALGGTTGSTPDPRSWDHRTGRKELWKPLFFSLFKHGIEWILRCCNTCGYTDVLLSPAP